MNEEYGSRNEFPVNLVVEMRFTTSTKVALAPMKQEEKNSFILNF